MTNMTCSLGWGSLEKRRNVVSVTMMYKGEGEGKR